MRQGWRGQVSFIGQSEIRGKARTKHSRGGGRGVETESWHLEWRESTSRDPEANEGKAENMSSFQLEDRWVGLEK